MANITTTDGSYGTYVRDLTDIEEEYNSKTKKQTKNSQAEIENLRAKQESQLQKELQNSANSVNNLKDVFNESIQRRNELNRTDIEQTKADLYNKYGKKNNATAEEYKNLANNTYTALEAEKMSGKQQIQNIENAHGKKMQDLSERHGKALSTFTEEVVNASKKDLDSQSEKNISETQKVRDEASVILSEQNRARAQEIYQERAKYQKAFDEIQNGINEKDGKEDVRQDRLADERQKSHLEALAHQARRLNDSHGKVTTELRSQLKTVVANDGLYGKEKGQGMRDGIKVYEDEWRFMNKSASEAYEAQIRNLKDKGKVSENILAGQIDDIKKETEQKYGSVLKKQTENAHNEQKVLLKNIENIQGTSDKLLKKERASNEARQQYSIEASQEQLSNALEKQNEAARATLSSQRAAFKAQANDLEGQLTKIKTTADISQVPVQAAQKLEEAIMVEQDRKLKAEFNRNQAGMQSIQEEYSDRMSQSTLDFQSRNAMAENTRQIEKHNSDRQVLSTILETEEQKQNAVRDLTQSHERQTEGLEKTFSKSLENQKRQNDEVLSTVVQDLRSKMQGMRQELEFNTRMSARASQNRQTEIIRDYEKRLSEQRRDYEDKLGVQKADLDKALREVDRKGKQSLEEQSKTYEQRIKEQETSYRERERMSIKNYDDQLEKVRRSNALMAQKKG